MLEDSGELFSYFKCPDSKTKNHDIEPWGKASKVEGGNWTCPKCGGKMIDEGQMYLRD